MMLQLKVIWHLFNLCTIAFAWTVRGSTGFTISAFSVEEQKLGYIPSAAPFLNGSTVQPPLTSHPFESSPPGPEHLLSTPTVSPTKSAVAPSTKIPPSPDMSIKISPSTEPPSSAPPPLPQAPSHDLAPQKPTQAHAPQPVVLPPHNETPSLPAVSPQASVPNAVPSHVPQPPVTPSHVFAPPPLVSPPTSATTPPSTTSPAISPSISSLPPPVLPLPSSVAPPPLPSKYASPPSIVAMPSHTVSALSPQTKPTHSKAPNHLASPSPLLEVMPLAVPSHEFGSPPAMPPKPLAPFQSSAPPQVIPSDVTAPPHPSATPPITLPSHVLVPPPFDKSQVLASPPIFMPNVSGLPPNSTISKHPSSQSPLPAPTHVSNPPPIVFSPSPGAVSSHDLTPPPTHTPYISAPPPNATTSQQSPAPLPPTPPTNASSPPPHAMSPIVSSPPPDAAPPHNLASSPPPESHFPAPPPNATISQHSSASPPPTPPMNSTNTPPRAISPIVSLPPPDAAPSHDLAPSPSAESHFSASPPSNKHNFSTPPTSSSTSKNPSNPPSSSVSSHASPPSTAAEPPLTASPPSVHTLPSGSLPPVTSNSSAPLAAPPVRSPSFDPVVPRESPSIPPEAQLPRVSSPAPSIDQRGHHVPVRVAPRGPTYPLSPTNDHPEQGFSPLIAPSTHKSRDLPTVAPTATISPPISPTAEAAHSPSFSPLPSTNKTQHKRDSSHFAPETSYTVPSSSPKQQGQVESPHSLLAPAPESAQRYHPPTSHNPGSSADMTPSQSPSTENYISPVPMSAIPVPSGHSMTPFLSPKISPSGSPTREPNIELAPPILALPPPPPNHDCLSYTCLEPYTNTIPGSPCGCVLPMKVELRIGVALYTFFPLVPELAQEIATGIFMKQSQVRIMGANAASDQPEKTLLLIDLVPLGDKFDNITAFLIYERFWNKQVAINKSVFGDYEVLYVQYPGLPPSPPTAPSDIADINGGAGDNGSKIHPLGVDVTKKGRKHRLSGSLIAIIVFSAVGAVLLCLLLGWILLFRHRRHVNQSSEAPHIYPASVARSTGPTGQSIGSHPSFSLSFESSVAAYTGSAKTFSASEIEKATDNFNLSRVLGEGGFGRVYSGILEDGTEVAVKVLKREDQQGGREFLAEIEMLSRLHHRNLVKLIGICVEEHVRCLIYELIRNGSVESHLHGIDKESSPLDWGARMKIALGAARGLAYLHEDSSPRVIHRDFKASNILLETDFTPKVSDFGLARTAMDEENMHISTRVMGTFGYVAPEYAMTGHLLVKSDVYSYGVVLLELLTGRKPVDMSQPPGQENLVAWTRPYLTTKEALKAIIDTNLGPDISFDNVAKVAAIASMCVQPEVSHRPFMGEVVQALKLVCNECDDAKDELDESPRSENLSLDRDGEKGLSASDVFSGTETGLGCKESGLGSRLGSGSFRRHSSSGPIGGRRSWRFWKRGRTTSSREDVVGENGLYRFWSGSH